MAISYAVALVEIMEGVPVITATAIGPQQRPWGAQVGDFGGRNFQVVIASAGTEDTSQEIADLQVRRILGSNVDLETIRNDGKNRSTRLMNFCLRLIGIVLRLRFAAAGLGGYLGGVDDIAKAARASLQGVMKDERNSEDERAEAENEVLYMTEDLESRQSLDKGRVATTAPLFDKFDDD